MTAQTQDNSLFSSHIAKDREQEEKDREALIGRVERHLLGGGSMREMYAPDSYADFTKKYYKPYRRGVDVPAMPYPEDSRHRDTARLARFLVGRNDRYGTALSFVGVPESERPIPRV